MDIFEAVYANNLSLINEMLTDVNVVDAKGNSPLMYAANKGLTDVGTLLIANGADINHISSIGATPLIVAVRRRHVEFVKLLLRSKNINVNLQTNDNALAAASRNYKAVEETKRFLPNIEIVELLLDGGADPNIVGEREQPLFSGVANVNIINLLLKYGADPNLVNPLGDVVLVYAAFEGVNDVCKTLLVYGAKPNQANVHGNTALVLAANKGHADVCTTLLEYGADINYIDSDGDTALMTAVYYWRLEVIKVLLAQPDVNVKIKSKVGLDAIAITFRDASQEEPNIQIVELLLKSGADPNSCYRGTPLIVLASSYLPIIDLLLKYGADPNLIIKPKGQTILTKLIKTKPYTFAEPIIRRLLEESTLDLDIIHSDGHTYLTQAVLTGGDDSGQYVRLLLEGGADPTIGDASGRTANYYAFVSRYIAAENHLNVATANWPKKLEVALSNLIKKFIVAKRLKQHDMISEIKLSEHIIRKAEHDQCMQSNLNKPDIVALARSLYIPTVNRSKIELYNEISNKLILH